MDEEEDDTALQAQLQLTGLYAADTIGDGNCLLVSVGFALMPPVILTLTIVAVQSTARSTVWYTFMVLPAACTDLRLPRCSPGPIRGFCRWELQGLRG